MRGPGIFSFKVLESPGKVLEFCSVISVATLKILFDYRKIYFRFSANDTDRIKISEVKYSIFSPTSATYWIIL